jgi:uncharacterized protein YjiS (DUF1127 family)
MTMALIEHSTRSIPFARTSRPSIAARLALWRSRRALARLDHHLLQDIGVTADDARREAALTVWDVPETWKNR